ncbi:Cytochrome c551 peroxidase precursor [Planctomycetes bacterium MalM25]|nr:Cytochrome c551 peroxidase precursor [Planctomycetes bacterium MalM25]
MSKILAFLLIGVLTGAGVYYVKHARTNGADPVRRGPALYDDRFVTVSTGDSESVVEEVRLGEGDLLRGIPGAGPLTLVEARAWLNDPANHRRLDPLLPIGLDEGAADLRGLEENPLTRAKIELGRQLYFDKRLSRDGEVSCASCHDPQHGFAFPTRFGVGVEGQEGSRNSPTAANRLLSDGQFWDGRAASLEEQAIGPLANPAEMAITHDQAVELCRQIAGYREQFESVFNDGVTIQNLGRALASFERVVVSGPSPWDHYRRLRRFESAYEGELDLLEPDLAAEHEDLQAAVAAAPFSESAARGAELFFGERTGCTQCHAGANFSDERYHNLGVGLELLDGLDEGEAIPESLDAKLDWGRYAKTGQEEDRGAFKTPGLRNVAQTAPYMHDGSQETLAEVVAWYVQGGHDNPYLSPLIAPLDLTEAEQADLVAFLEALTGEWPDIETGRLPADEPER